MSIFTGAAVAIATPFNNDGSVNYENLDNLIEFQIKNNTDAIVICGTTGEASTLSHEEHIDVIKHCVQTVNHRVPVIAGTGSNSTETAIYLSQEAEKAGADAVLLVTPYYNKATQKGLYVHFKDTADAISLPCILYNVPSRTGCNILPETAVKLAKDVDNIVAIKEASGNLSQIAKLLQLADGCIDVYSGNDDQIVPIMSLGGLGVISVLSNVAPQQTHDLCQACLDNDFKKAAKMQLEALPLIDALFSEVNPIPVKKALNIMGFEAGPLRKPLTEMEDAHAKTLEEAMKSYGIY
ncbi:4-hydroxy-tetrahydrodipicolinate synthase [Pseudobutyrivibrio sp. ACV-2]|uniref:4-hydroxy-tetrahydrodipicolinate synthase n=1 Tax=Pseudobutyrivibrio sp. ACV-2 TaxID=1520801 RepID=UPI000896A725|nr:4-hydroxy-tetrahydrodipicolinate synthase [Pseudobutyrivibrio sp. ACV-2]SEA72023.1 4-hydroxy-tetrahydrodipicolinate synthase [Pseudobutyrivibrio sp. ACV-2]